jgi:hypothetical protein
MLLKKLLIDLLQRNQPQHVCTDINAWLSHWREKQKGLASDGPFITAVNTAIQADRVAWAFFSGYQAAIQETFGKLCQPEIVNAICVNESGRKISEITTELVSHGNSHFLNGCKSWSLAGIENLTMYVLARKKDGPEKGPGSLAFVQLSANELGVAMGGAKMQKPVPELPHAEVFFNSVAVSASRVVPGDGYADFAKPFRLREDIFVTACTLAYLLGEGKNSDWPTLWTQKCIAAICGLYSCSTLDPHASETHILTAGVLNMAGDVMYESEFLWGKSAKEKSMRWHRDFSLLSLGREARRQRAIKSWRSKGWMVSDYSGLGDHTSGGFVI